MAETKTYLTSKKRTDTLNFHTSGKWYNFCSKTGTSYVPAIGTIDDSSLDGLGIISLSITHGLNLTLTTTWILYPQLVIEWKDGNETKNITINASSKTYKTIGSKTYTHTSNFIFPTDAQITPDIINSDTTSLKYNLKATHITGADGNKNGSAYVPKNGDNIKYLYTLGDPVFQYITPIENQEFNQYIDSIPVSIPADFLEKDEESHVYKAEISSSLEATILQTLVLEKDEDSNTYNCIFNPITMSGEYEIKCFADEEEVINSSILIIVNPYDIISTNYTIERFSKTESNSLISDFMGNVVKINLDLQLLAENFLNKELVAVLIPENEENLSEEFLFESNNKKIIFENTLQDGTRLQEGQEWVLHIAEKTNIPDSDPTIYSTTIIIPSAKPIFNVEEHGVAIGQFSTGTADSQKFECAWPAIFSKIILKDDSNNLYEIKIENGGLVANLLTNS